MSFAPRNKCINDADLRINNVSIQGVYVTKILGVVIDSKLIEKITLIIFVRK